MTAKNKKKPRTQIYLGSFQVRAVGPVADDVDLGVWLSFKEVEGLKEKASALCMLTADGARRLGKKLLRAADKVGK